MDLAEAINLIVSRTGHARYRDLCDPTHPAHHPAYVDFVLRFAGASPPAPRPTMEPPPATSGVAASLDVIRGRDSCRHYVPRRRFAELGIADCGCGLDHCRVGRGREGGITLADCASCPDLPHLR